jgi:quercetin dioxygenase-like cupin family protein
LKQPAFNGILDRMTNARATLITCAAFTGLLVSGCASARPDKAPVTPKDATVRQLMQRDLEQSGDKEVTMLTVEYGPGGASLPHRHNAQVFVYVLEGSVRMQVEGSPPVTLGPGETFYESSSDVHTVSANASTTQVARLLVVMIKSK